MSIPISPTPGNNKTLSTPMFQDWGPMPNPHHNEIYYFAVTGASPVMEPITFKIKDVIGLAETAQYSQFRLKAYQHYLSGNPINWVNPSGYTGKGYPNDLNAPIPITENGMEFEFSPVIMNLNLLPYGIYSFYHNFYIEGLATTGWVQISAYEHRIRLYTTNTPISISPNNFLLQHTYGGVLPHKDITLYGDDWTVVGNPRVKLTSSSAGSQVEEITDENGTYQKVRYSLGGTSNLRVALTDFYDQIAEFDPSVLNVSLPVIAGSSTLSGYINFSIEVHLPDTFILTPTSLSFFAVKGIDEAEPQELAFICNNPYTLSFSPWLTAHVAQILRDGLIYQRIIVQPIPSANMTAGTYTGDVGLSTYIAGEEHQLNAQVTYVISDFISLPVMPGNVAFTLDSNEVLMSTTNLGTYFQTTAKIKTFDFFSSEIREYVIPQKFVPFHGKATFDLSPTIHDLMPRIAEITNNEFQYKPAQLVLTIEEKQLINNNVIRSATTEEIPWVAGPGHYIQNSGFLDFNPLPKRIFPEGSSFLNMLLQPGMYLLRTIKNGDVISETAMNTDELAVKSTKIHFEGAAPGDVFEVALLDLLGGVTISVKKYLIFPIQDHSVTIVWEDEFLLQSDFECGGGFSVKTEIEKTTQKKYKKLIEALEVISVSKEAKFFVNTGWVSMHDVDAIESLMSAKRAWLSGERTLKLVPIGKSIINQDSERELIEYALEFQINKNYAQETYTFKISN